MEVNEPEQNAMQKGLTDRWVQWQPPLVGWRVLNTDGAVKGVIGPAGAGGVIRDDNGQWVMGFSEYLSHCTAVKAELHAALRGLQFAKAACIQKLWLQMDSTVVVDMLTRVKPWHTEFSSLLHQCHNLLNWEGWEVKVTHCYREANRVADKLAQMGLTGQLGAITYQTPPRETQEALYADTMGVSWPRHFST